MADKVLLVDDEVDFVDVLAKRMEARGLDVDVAYDGEQALDKSRSRRYDAFVLDLAMPGMSGMEVLRKLREENPDRQIILLTGHGNVQAAVEATHLGAMDFLEKPTDIKTLLERIREARARRLALDQKRSEDEIADLLLTKGW
jgi:DNA-binding NtrC family response regulator